jgi:hypothetical protein
MTIQDERAKDFLSRRAGKRRRTHALWMSPIFFSLANCPLQFASIRGMSQANTAYPIPPCHTWSQIKYCEHYYCSYFTSIMVSGDVFLRPETFLQAIDRPECAKVLLYVVT